VPRACFVQVAPQACRHQERRKVMSRALQNHRSTPSEAMKRIPSLNGQELLARVDNDVDLVKELTAIFCEECPRHLANLQTALAEGKAASLRQTGHTLKGMLANLAAPVATDLAAQIENLGKKGQVSSARLVFEALKAEVPRVEKALKDLTAGQDENSDR